MPEVVDVPAVDAQSAALHAVPPPRQEAVPLVAAAAPPAEAAESVPPGKPVKVKRRVARDPEPTVALAGRVIAKGSGAPIEGVEVYVDPNKGRIRMGSRSGRGLQAVPSTGQPCDAVTDGKGVFRLDAPATEAVWLTCVATGWSSREAELRSSKDVVPLVAEDPFAEVPRAVVEMERDVRVEGNVAGVPEGVFVRATFLGGSLIDDGRPGDWTDPRAMAGDQYVQTAVSPGGEFVLTGLPGRTALTLALVGSAAKEAAVLLQEIAPVILQPGEVHRVDWTLADCGSVACMAHGPDGVAVQGVELWLITPSQARLSVSRQIVRPISTVKTDESGQAMITGVSLGEWAVARAGRHESQAPGRLRPVCVAVHRGVRWRGRADRVRDP